MDFDALLDKYNAVIVADKGFSEERKVFFEANNISFTPSPPGSQELGRKLEVAMRLYELIAFIVQLTQKGEKDG